MKKILTSIAFILLLASSFASAQSAGSSLIQRKPLNGSSGVENMALAEPALNSLYVYDRSARYAKFFSIGAGLNCSNGACTVDPVPGPDGKSAYDVALDYGFTGTASQWLESLKVKGDAGPAGVAGPAGIDGRDGAPGVPGAQGQKGDPGQDGAPGATGPKGDKGDKGEPGTTDYTQLTNRPSLAPVATAGTYSSLTGIPTAFAPSAHMQAWGTITGTPTTCLGYGIADCATTSQLAAKFNAPAGTTAQYVRGDGSLATFPTVPVINRAIVTTAADGTYTWTLPTACASGQSPVVSISPENSAAGEVINHKITAKTNASVTISLSRAVITLNGLLGLNIPVLQTSPGAQAVHLIAICP